MKKRCMTVDRTCCFCWLCDISSCPQYTNMMVVGRETAQGLRVLVMTRNKFNEIVSSGSRK
eukprot:11846030-Karenia_brevis.AAC.1